MGTFATKLLTDCFTAQGMDPAMAAHVVSCFMETALAAEIIEQHTLDLWERDAMIYHRRGVGTLSSALTVGFTMSRATIFRIIRRHSKRRRAALRYQEEDHLNSLAS